MEGKVCSKCGIWRPIEEYHKNKASKDGRQPKCKECQKEYDKQKRLKKHPKKIKKIKEIKETREGMKKCTKCKQWKLLEEYHKDKQKKDGKTSQCKECQKEQHRQHYQNNKEHMKEQHKEYYQNNKEHHKEQMKQWKEKNPEYDKQRYQNNKEHEKEKSKQRYQNNKENNLQYISSIVEQINPVFKQLNLPVYGYVYMFENVNTGHKYVGQSTLQLKTRYGYEGGIVKSWIKERLKYNNQKFKEELIEENFIVTETLDVAFCQYHLDKLEAYYIDKYDSCNNGYNNNAGHYNTDDGIEEFNQILKENNLQFINGKLIRMKEAV